MPRGFQQKESNEKRYDHSAVFQSNTATINSEIKI